MDFPENKLDFRHALAGAVIGIANLVPGLAGGTILVVCGVHTSFIRAVSEISTLRLTRNNLKILGVIVACAALVMLVGAGLVKDVILGYRAFAYSLFIGLTLGGIPVLRRLAAPTTPRFWIAAAITVCAMVAFVLSNAVPNLDPGTVPPIYIVFAAGFLGAMALLLPGLDGSYLLILLGVYLPVLNSLDVVSSALRSAQWGALVHPITSVILPLSLGICTSIALMSNLMKRLLQKHPQPTYGALLGMLVGSVAGLWPFRVEVVDPLTHQTLTKLFLPSFGEHLVSLAFVAIGLCFTLLIDRVARKRDPALNTSAPTF